MPPSEETVTSTLWLEPDNVMAGTTIVNEVPLGLMMSVERLAGLFGPKLTDVMPDRFVPVTVTVVPPLDEPKAGSTPVMVGVGALFVFWYVNLSAAVVADVPITLVTVTSTGTALLAPAGLSIVIEPFALYTSVDRSAAKPPN